MAASLEEPTDETAARGPCGPGVVDIADPARLVDARVREWLAGKVAEALGVLRARGSVSARIVDDREMAEAHERYKGVPGTTDVLTFDLGGGSGAGEGGGEVEADLLICVDEARRQAAARGHGAERELLLYILHGVLHCLGHDDHGEAEAARMHAEEDRVLAAIGVGAVYAREEGP